MKRSARPFVSPRTKLLASLQTATYRPSGDTDGLKLSPVPRLLSLATLTRTRLLSQRRPPAVLEARSEHEPHDRRVTRHALVDTIRSKVGIVGVTRCLTDDR